MAPRPLLFVLALLAASALAPLSVAQDGSPPPPAPGNGVFYAHTNEAGDLLWMNTLATDPTGAGVSVVGYQSTQTVPVAGTAVPAAPQADASVVWDFPLAPALGQTLVLDAAATVDMTAYIGGGQFSFGTADIVARLLSGETIIAEGSLADHRFTPAPTATTPTGQPTPGAPYYYNVAEIAMTIAETIVPAGQPLVWHIEIVSSGNNLFMSTSEGRGQSNIELPIVGLGGALPEVDAIEYIDVDDEVFQLEVVQDEAFNGTLQANWTTTFTRGAFAAAANLTSGSMGVTIRDGANATVADFVLSGVDSTTLAIPTATPGNWTLTFVATDFAGEFAIVVSPVEETTTDDGGDDGDDGSDDDASDDATPDPTDDGTTDTTTDEPTRDTPALGPLGFVVGAFALALRRRLQ